MLGVDWTPDDDTLIYGKYNRGYKPGGLGCAATFCTQVATPFTDKELVDAFELGFKREWPELEPDHERHGVLLRLPRLSGLEHDRSGRPGRCWSRCRVRAVCVVRQPAAVPRRLASSLRRSGTRRTTCASCSTTATRTRKSATRRLWFTRSIRLRLDAGRPTAWRTRSLRRCWLPRRPGSEPEWQHPALQPEEQDLRSTGPTPGTWKTARQIDTSLSYFWQDVAYSSIFNRGYTEIPAWDQTDGRVTWTSADGNISLIGFVRNMFDQIVYDSRGAGLVETASTSTVTPATPTTPTRYVAPTECITTAAIYATASALLRRSPATRSVKRSVRPVPTAWNCRSGSSLLDFPMAVLPQLANWRRSLPGVGVFFFGAG